VRCDDTMVVLSERADGEADAADARTEHVDEHLSGCADCRRFERDIGRVRSYLRVEPVGRAPDVAPAVVAAHEATLEVPAPSARGGRRLAAVAAVAALAGLVAGATFVGIGRRPHSPAAADIPDRVLAAQHEIVSLDSRLSITEAVAGDRDTTRTFAAELTYRAPESLALRVRETTGRPDDADVADNEAQLEDLSTAADAQRTAGGLVVDGDRWWQRTARRCSPAAGRVSCPADPVTWTRSVTGREPFSDAAPVPLELVSPVESFTLATAPSIVGERTIAGRPAVGVSVTAAQVAPLLDGFAAAVELGPVHPTDRVDLWLDDEHLVPLGLEVRASTDPARARWAAAVGAADRPGEVVLRVDADAAEINRSPGAAADTADAALALPDDPPSSATDDGFRPATSSDPVLARVPVPDRLPAGLRPHRSGTLTTPGGPDVGVRSWSDGRAWLTVRATDEWPGGRLFGRLGLDVTPVDLGPAGTGYVASGGRRVGLHTDGIDVVVSGSLPIDQLQRVAAGLGLVGRPVPADWAEATTADREEAVAVVPGLLTARGAVGFVGDPALRVVGDTVHEVWRGPGARAFTLTQRIAPVLPPPSTGDETGIEVRGRPGRFSPERGELEWVEDGVVLSLRSPTLALGELVAIAEGLEPA
jgi:hypothetical protein